MNTMKRTVLTSLAALLLVACALPLPDKPERPQPYDLGPARVAAAQQPSSDVVVALDTVVAPAVIDTTRIVYRLLYAGRGQQPRPYAQARWSMTPPQLVGQRLREALATRHPVLNAGTGLPSLELRVELDDFSQAFSSPEASQGLVRLRVTALAIGSESIRLLGQRTFRAEHPAPTPDADGGVRALRDATDQVTSEIIDWVGSLPPPH